MKKKSSTVLELKDLSIRRGTTQILSELNWRIECGEHWVILGANGSGKTSLLSSLLGYFTPTCGSIALFGEEYGQSDWRKLRLKIGIVSSSLRQMMPDHEPAIITVASGKYAMIDFWGMPKRADMRQAAERLKEVECSCLADREWGYLSQGERQRVLIARSMMAAPRLLILDEPCAGLDPAAREKFLEFVQRLGERANAPSLVLVTHHVEEIVPVFTDALLLKDGTSLAAGPIKTVLTSKNLSAVFGSKMKVRKSKGRFALEVAAA
jgi:iron complex transport system ATP-binding protein